MSNDRLTQILSDCCNDVTFSLNGINCAIFPSVVDSKASYSAWYGDDNRIFNSIDDLMGSNFFGGMILKDIVASIDIQTY